MQDRVFDGGDCALTPLLADAFLSTADGRPRRADFDINEAAALQPSNTLTDDEVIAKASASKNGAKFTVLWKGDTSGYPTHSEADLALCSLLAFWTNRDPAQMDRLFRRSKLIRDKWDERRGTSTYGEDVIAKAISLTPKGYQVAAHRVELIRASDVTPIKVEWLWNARLARGAITLVEGAAEKGKSTVTIDLAAHTSRGHSFPGENLTREPANVVMLVAEDDIQATVVPRLMAAGADLTRIYFLGVTRDDQGEIVPFHLSDDCERLRVKCEEVNAIVGDH